MHCSENKGAHQIHLSECEDTRLAINMHWIKIFIMVARTGSFTQTAAEMYISQPSVSKSIHNLEAELNVKLFIRDRKNGLSLTDTGKKVLKTAQQLSEDENLLLQTAFEANHQLGGRLRIGSLPIISTTVLAKVFGIFKAQYPLVEIELTEGNARDIKQLLQDNAIDVGITTSPNNLQNGQRLFTDHMVALSAESSEPVDLTDSEQTFIFCKAGAETVIDTLNKKNNFNVNNWLIVDRGETVVAMVENNVGTGIISNYVLENTAHPSKIHVKTILPKIDLDYDLLISENIKHTSLISKFVEILNTCK